jgi:hypothetical protein
MSDWGKGVNNDIGWGQGANNDIGWGSIYDKSNAGETLLLRDNSPLKLATEVFSIYDIGLSYSGDVINVRRISDDVTQLFSISELNDGTSLNDFLGSGTGKMVHLIDQIGGSNTTPTLVANEQPVLYEDGVYLGSLKRTAPQRIRTIFNESKDVTNFISTIVFSSERDTRAFSSVTQGNNSSIFVNLNNQDESPPSIDLQSFSGGSIRTLDTDFDSVINLQGISVFSSGFQSGNMIAKLNTENAVKNTNSVGQTLAVDEDFGGRNKGNAVESELFIYARFENSITDEFLESVHTYLKSKLKLIEPVVVSGFPVTVVPGILRSCTGLSYNFDLDELIVSNADTENSPGSRTNKLMRYDRQTLNLIGEITVPFQGVLQDNLYFNGLYYIGGQTLTGYDVSGTLIETITLPVTPRDQNTTDFHDGFLYVMTAANDIVKINPSTLAVVETINVQGALDRYGITLNEGLAVNSKYFVFAETNRNYVFDKNLRKVGTWNSRWSEGMTFDPDGNLFVNRNEGFHDGTANGNAIWKYDLQE